MNHDTPRIAFIGSSFGEQSGPIKRASKIKDHNLIVDVVSFYSFNRLFMKTGMSCEEEVRSLYRSQKEYVKKSINGKAVYLDSNSPLSLKPYVRLYKYLKHSSLKAVYCHHNLIGAISAIISKTVGIKKVFVVEMSDLSRRNKISHILSGLSYLFCDQIICISQSTKKSMNKWERWCSKGKVVVIYNGIDLNIVQLISNKDTSSVRKTYNIHANEKIILSTGRLHPVKNYSLLLEAFVLLTEKQTDITLIIAGVGFYAENLKHIIQKLGLNDRAHLIGNIPLADVYSLLKESSVFVMTSFSEGFSESMLQALAFRKPIVATNNASFNEALSGNAGIISEYSPSEIALNIALFLENKELRDKYSHAAGIKSLSYDIELIAKQYIKLIGHI